MLHKQVIRIEQCTDTKLWYAGSVGSLFAVLGYTDLGHYIVSFESETYDFQKVVHIEDAVIVTGKDRLYMIPVIDLNNDSFDKGWHIRAGFRDRQDFYNSVGHGESLLNLVVKDYRGDGDDDILLDIPFADDTMQGIYKGLDEDDVEGGYFKLLEYLAEDNILEVVVAKTWKIDGKEYVYWLDVYNDEGVI